MINLVCFPHYTCGGLLCDILHAKMSNNNQVGGIDSAEHNIAKIGDNNSVYDNYDIKLFYDTVEQYKKTLSNNEVVWAGTHCWPGLIDSLQFNKIINVTTLTLRSKIYRWARSYHLYYKPRVEYTLDTLKYKDIMRNTAKNYIKPFLPVKADNIINIEFSEIVEETVYFQKIIKSLTLVFLQGTIENWKETNNFLYSANFWNSTEVKLFHEAEYEVLTGTEYVYQ